MTELLFKDDKRTDPNGYDAALRALNVYFGADAESECAEDLFSLSLLWDGRKCACGDCDDCWFFSGHRGTMGPLSFWVHGEHVEQFSIMGQTPLIEVHDLVLA